MYGRKRTCHINSQNIDTFKVNQSYYFGVIDYRGTYSNTFIIIHNLITCIIVHPWYKPNDGKASYLTNVLCAASSVNEHVSANQFAFANAHNMCMLCIVQDRMRIYNLCITCVGSLRNTFSTTCQRNSLTLEMKNFNLGVDR